MLMIAKLHCSSRSSAFTLSGSKSQAEASTQRLARTKWLARWLRGGPFVEPMQSWRAQLTVHRDHAAALPARLKPVGTKAEQAERVERVAHSITHSPCPAFLKKCRKGKRGPNEIPACCMPLAEPSANARNVGRVGAMVLTQSRTVKPLDAAILFMTVDGVALRDSSAQL